MTSIEIDRSLIDIDYNYEEEDTSDVDKELRPVIRRTAKHIAAGEERPRINSSQQTTPIDECPPETCVEETQTDPPAPLTSEESDAPDSEGKLSTESSPLRRRRGGILKGGRLWKSLDADKDFNEQNDDQRSTTTASDEDGSVTPRSVRFVERPQESKEEEPIPQTEPESAPASDDEMPIQKDTTANTTHRLETPLILTIQTPKTNSAVQQLFNSNRPPPPAIEPQLITSETLRAWDAGVRPKAEDVAVRRVAERNALRCSLLRSEARKKQQAKQETTSLAERIRLLTCDVEDEPAEDRASSANVNVDKLSTSSDKSSDKSFTSMDKNSEKAFGSASSSSSSSTLSAPMLVRQHPPDLGDVHHEQPKPRPEPRRQFLSTLAPLTACVGNAAHHEGFYYVPPGDRTSAATNNDYKDHNEAPAPDVVAGTPGANDGDDGLAAFARASAPRTERIRQRYGQDSHPVSSDDEHDDYGFHRRPAVRGIAVKQQLGTSNDMLQQMQNELQPTSSTAATHHQPHACQRTSSTYSWPYYSEANLNSRPQSRTSTNTNWMKATDHVVSRQCSISSMPQQQHSEMCHAHAQNMVPYPQYQQRQPENMFRNCSLYANIGCSDSSQELYSSQTSSEQTSPVRAAARGRRPESPPPIRSHHQLLYVPYSSHHHYQHEYPAQWAPNDYNRQVQSYYQQQARSGASTPQPNAALQQRAHYSHALQLQNLCPAPARYRPVLAAQPGGGKQMICYSEKVAPPLYQPAPGSPSRVPRAPPEGAASASQATSATSPLAPPQNPVYYAMNV
ncbi:PREDICTED: uncharacterized protein LOC106110069 [Papilio polytes]|uniref:uncharacterized protein LOC106110069 n=1 Tax=Papilio polytes TaxID=76194 RepID=UPI000675BBCE|nr:PREDICTED: uncharacterized protein LOC106110069 [Papilio polytes]